MKTNNEIVRKSGIYLTEKGKGVYGDRYVEVKPEVYMEVSTRKTYVKYVLGLLLIALNPLELKALVDLGLVEIV